MTKDGLRTPNYWGSLTQAATVRVGNVNGEEAHAPVSSLLPMVHPNDIELGGWDISGLNLADAMERAKVIDWELQKQLVEMMAPLVPLPGAHDGNFIAANQGERADNVIAGTKQEQLEKLREDIREFKRERGVSVLFFSFHFFSGFAGEEVEVETNGRKKTHSFLFQSFLSIKQKKNLPAGRIRHRALDRQHRALRRDHRGRQRHPRKLSESSQGKPFRGRPLAAVCRRFRLGRLPLHQRLAAEHFRPRPAPARRRKRCPGRRGRLQVGTDQDEERARGFLGRSRDQADVDRVVQPPGEQRRDEPLGAADVQEQGDLQGQRGRRHGERRKRREKE